MRLPPAQGRPAHGSSRMNEHTGGAFRNYTLRRRRSIRTDSSVQGGLRNRRGFRVRESGQTERAAATAQFLQLKMGPEFRLVNGR